MWSFRVRRVKKLLKELHALNKQELQLMKQARAVARQGFLKRKEILQYMEKNPDIIPDLKLEASLRNLLTSLKTNQKKYKTQ